MTDLAPKCALIVDDSQTARRVLGKVLEQHQIKVEMAESAEEALNYLAAARPDVIFMDHLMPGMDGFQAVRAIKNNPETATIPIMMYTSQAGELYVSQARALGAVGVLPKQIKPVQVADTLKSLNLISDPVTPADTVDAPEIVPETDVDQTLADVERMMEPADWSELHSWFEQMLRHHEDVLRTDIESSVARLLKESSIEQEMPATDLPTGIFGKELFALRSLNATTLLVAGLSLFAATFFWMYINTQEAWRAVYDQNVQLLSAIEAERAAARASSAAAAGRIRLQPTYNLRAFVSDLEWQANGNTTYSSGEIPFGDQRLKAVDRMVSELRAIGFHGVVQLDSHVGDFCYVQADDGSWSLGAADQPMSDCGRIGMGAENALVQSAKQSVAFANYVAALDGNGLANISVVVNALGNSSPILSYPQRSADSTAGEWNRIAKQNNRVQVRLIADEWAERPSADLF